MPTYGFSLIEILVSLLLFSLILLGLDAMEIQALAQLKNTCLLQQAGNQLDALTERLYTANATTDLEQWVAEWNMQNQAVLPNGYGELIGTFPDYTAIIYWGKSLHHCAQNKTGATGCLKITVQLA